MSIAQPLLGYGNSGPPTGIVWTDRGDFITGGGGAYALGADDAGNTLAVALDGTVYKSTDGGINWATIGAIANFPAPQVFGPLVFSAGTWLISQDNTASVVRSTDGGVTWVPHAHGINNAGGVILGTDGAGAWVGIGNDLSMGGRTDIYAHSVDDGVTWNSGANVTAITGNSYPSGRVLWNGTDWVFGSLDPADLSSANIWSSADAENWTQQLMANPANFISGIQLIAGTYYAASALNVLSAVSVVGLLTPTVTPVPLTMGDSISFLLDAGVNKFAFDFSGAVANAPSFTGSWLPGTQSFSPGDTVAGVAYDVVNNSAIAVSALGRVCTVP